MISSATPLSGLTAHAGGLGLLRLQTVVQHLDSDVNVDGLPSDRDKALVRVRRLPWSGRSSRFSDADLALGLGTDLVNLRACFANDCASQ